MIDPLQVNVALQGVDTTIPLLPEGDYRFQVVESTVDPNKDRSGLNWNLKLALVDPATSTDGREIKPNFPVFAVYALQAASESKDVEAFKRNLGQAVDAIFNTSKDNRPNFDRELVNSCVGKTVVATVVLNEWPQGSGQFNNKVRRLKADVS
jgi:hypothetical protein